MATTTPNMLLTEPVPSTDPGPTWAQQLNTNSDLIDAHDHSSGKGVKVGVPGLSINADLPFQQNRALDVKALRLYAFTTTPEGGFDSSYNNSFVVVGSTLKFITDNGTVKTVTLV